MTQKRLTRIALSALAAPLLIGMTACGGSTDSDAASTVTVTEDSSSATASTTTTTSTENADTNEHAEHQHGQPDIHYTLNGTDAPGAFVTHKCKVTQDEVEFKAADKTNNGEEIKVDLDLNPLKLDEIELYHEGVEYETTEAQEADADVSQSNGSYTVRTQATSKADAQADPIDVEISFSCGAH